MAELIDIIGNKYGRLLVIKKAEISKKHNKARWLCRCDCGNELIVDGYSLRSGHTKSCGCYYRDFMKTKGITHNMSRTRLYRCYISMKDRCYRRNILAYKDYGEKGIKVCDEWQEFDPFMKWALSNGYNDKLTLERIDNSKNYSPENCRWATRTEQNRNTTRNVRTIIDGKQVLLVDIARMANVDRSMVSKIHKVDGLEGKELLNECMRRNKSS